VEQEQEQILIQQLVYQALVLYNITLEVEEVVYMLHLYQLLLQMQEALEVVEMEVEKFLLLYPQHHTMEQLIQEEELVVVELLLVDMVEVLA
tara:strand:+ start:451 stop:726 length:276 start_codon:yes stop_codon:yes gene_type:complete